MFVSWCDYRPNTLFGSTIEFSISDWLVIGQPLFWFIRSTALQVQSGVACVNWGQSARSTAESWTLVLPGFSPEKNQLELVTLLQELQACWSKLWLQREFDELAFRYEYQAKLSLMKAPFIRSMSDRKIRTIFLNSRFNKNVVVVRNFILVPTVGWDKLFTGAILVFHSRLELRCDHWVSRKTSECEALKRGNLRLESRSRRPGAPQRGRWGGRHVAAAIQAVQRLWRPNGGCKGQYRPPTVATRRRICPASGGTAPRTAAAPSNRRPWPSRFHGRRPPGTWRTVIELIADFMATKYSDRHYYGQRLLSAQSATYLLQRTISTINSASNLYQYNFFHSGIFRPFWLNFHCIPLAVKGQ